MGGGGVEPSGGVPPHAVPPGRGGSISDPVLSSLPEDTLDPDSSAAPELEGASEVAVLPGAVLAALAPPCVPLVEATEVVAPASVPWVSDEVASTCGAHPANTQVPSNTPHPHEPTPL